MRNPELRARLILEEAVETVVALVGLKQAVTMVSDEWDSLRLEYLHPDDDEVSEREEPNLVEVIDGLCDTIVVCLGTAEDIGIDLEPFYDEVMKTNMAKAGGPIDKHGKMLKPPGWAPPDIAGVLAKLIERMTLHKVGDSVTVNPTCRRGCCDEGSFKAVIDELFPYAYNGEQVGAWVKDTNGNRTYQHFTSEKGVME